MLTPEKGKKDHIWPGVKGLLEDFLLTLSTSYLLVRNWVFPEGLSFQAWSQGDNLRR